MMHPKLTAAAAMAVLLTAPALAQTDMLGVPGPILFQGEDYALAWTSQPSDAYFKQEYVPVGQAVETYADMVLVEAVAGAITPAQAAASQVEMLASRKDTDPVVNHEIIRNEVTGEVLLDFLVSDLSADPILVEWNAYRYLPLAEGEGVALFAISRRGYGEDGVRAFLGDLGTVRGEAINALATFDIPAIGIR
ncbi:hypothetical protein O9Z70_11220 [Devosia sp. YIM 151766]|uniref:hypothetical protein n=1 Tax=Devosia sp. YIM 151766 TaxID=3017325 RepID=UPI00255C8455|nr:hypothetical protein [Devosia sp. YIM 151766]WIY52050.1 hypothetical protein O9Z70_11220 [Devosia sp. YIM 151766]